MADAFADYQRRINRLHPDVRRTFLKTGGVAYMGNRESDVAGEMHPAQSFGDAMGNAERASNAAWDRERSNAAINRAAFTNATGREPPLGYGFQNIPPEEDAQFRKQAADQNRAAIANSSLRGAPIEAHGDDKVLIHLPSGGTAITSTSINGKRVSSDEYLKAHAFNGRHVPEGVTEGKTPTGFEEGGPYSGTNGLTPSQLAAYNGGTNQARPVSADTQLGYQRATTGEAPTPFSAVPEGSFAPQVPPLLARENAAPETPQRGVLGRIADWFSGVNNRANQLARTGTVAPAPTATPSPGGNPLNVDAATLAGTGNLGRSTEAGVSNAQAARIQQPTNSNPTPTTPTSPATDINNTKISSAPQGGSQATPTPDQRPVAYLPPPTPTPTATPPASPLPQDFASRRYAYEGF